MSPRRVVLDEISVFRTLLACPPSSKKVSGFLPGIEFLRYEEIDNGRAT
jgi:hypothetical protein